MEKSKRNLYIILDFVDPEKDEIYIKLRSKKKEYLFLNGQPFCNNPLELRYYREVWLELCKNVSDQLDMDIVFCGELEPIVIESLGNPGFSSIKWLAIVSEEEKVLKRCERSNCTEKNGILLRNNWIKENFKTEYSQVEVLDISEFSDEAVVDAIHTWILENSGK